jgi:type II secretory pathway pseudopilin PulG
MDIPEGPGLVLGIVGFILSVFAVVISWESLDTNKVMARAAAESARTAREAVEAQRRAEQRARKACLQVARDQYARGILTFDRDEEYEGTTGGVTFYLRNEGNAAAVNCSLELHADGLDVVGESGKRIEPGAIGELSTSFPYHQLLQGDDKRDFTVEVTFHDHLGVDNLLMGMTAHRYDDPTSPWYIQLKPEAVKVSELCRPLAAI